MSCEHCARAVREELGKIPGVAAVEVDVAAGTVQVSAEPMPGDAVLGEAIAEAGYEFGG